MLKSLLTTALVGTALAAPAAAETIGVALARADSVFLTILLNGMQAEAARHPGVTLQVEDGQNDTSRQINQVQNFVAAGVDAMIVVTVDASATPQMTRMATEAGIPIVYANHPPGDLETLPEGAAFVGSNEVESGTLQTREVCRLLGGKGRAFVLMGPLNNESALQRTKDIHDVLATGACQGMEVIDEQSANWDRLEGANITTNWLTSGEPFKAVIANNDEMAIGAIHAMQQAGVDMDRVVVAGIDATPEGLAAMEAGELDVTVFQDAKAQGAASVRVALAMIRGEPYEQRTWIPFELVTPANMEEYKSR